MHFWQRSYAGDLHIPNPNGMNSRPPNEISGSRAGVAIRGRSRANSNCRELLGPRLRLSGRGDRAAIVVATLCFVHCVAGPALIAFAGFASLIQVSEKCELLFLAGSGALGALALIPGYRRRHGRPTCLILFTAGFLTLGARKFISARLEGAMALAGASLITTAHLLNLRYSKRCPCCEAGTSTVEIPGIRERSE